MELLFSILSVEIFERASLLVPKPWKEPALSKMKYVSDRNLLQLTLDEVYGVSRIDLCLYGVEDRSFSYHFARMKYQTNLD